MSDRRAELRRIVVKGLAATAGAAVLSYVNLPFRDSDAAGDSGGNDGTFDVPLTNPGADQLVVPVSKGLFTNPKIALAQCVPVVILNNDCPKTAEFVIYGERRVNGEITDETALGVDLRLSLSQDPKNTYRWGTFKTGEYQERHGFATLIEMGPVINGVEHGKPKLDLYTKRFLIEGCYPYDYEALIEECGREVLAPAWKVDVERIVKEEGQRVFRHEYSFGVVPDCGLAKREYIDNVTRQVIVPTRATPVPISTPSTGTGTPGRQPAQIPTATPRTGGGSESAPTTPIENLPHITPWPTPSGR